MAESWLSRLLRREPDRAGRRRAPAPAVPTQDAARPPVASRTNPYQAVSVIACPQACGAACAVQAQRFLARQAPRLPLPACDRAAACRCRFEKFVDRRTAAQRSPYNNPHSMGYGGVEKRRNRGRRATDR